MIRSKQIDLLQESLAPTIRTVVVETFVKKGFQVQNDPENSTVTLKDKSGGKFSIRSINGDIALISAKNRIYRFKYDSKNQLVAITDPRGFLISFERDDQQRLIGIRREC